MQLSNKRILAVAVLALVLLSSVVFGVSAAVIVVAPLNGTNHSSASDPLFNVTFVNATDLYIAGLTQTDVNATFYRESGSTRTAVGNSSTCEETGVANTFACWGYLTLSASDDGFFNISAQIFNSTGGSVNSSVNTTSIYFDSTVPEVAEANLTSPLSWYNYSDANNGLLILNVSVIDLTIGLDSVFFNVTNSSGVQNATYSATNLAGDWWNATLNTTHFPDGVYNITVFANDSVGNLNNTATVFQITFDNSLPTGSFSCTPNSVQTGDTITCSCSGSAVSGVQSVSYSVNPDTSLTGTFTPQCSLISYSGLTNILTTTYTIDAILNARLGGGSPSTTTKWQKTIPGSDKELSEKGTVSKTLARKERVSLMISGETHYVGVTSINVDRVEIQVASDPQTATLGVGESQKFEVTGDRIYDLMVTLTSIEQGTGKAVLEIVSIQEEVSSAEIGEGYVGEGEDQTSGDSAGEGMAKKSGVWNVVLGVLIVLIVIVFVAWKFKWIDLSFLKDHK